MPLRFVFAVHNHQPVGNFGHVFEAAYNDAYRPFLDLIEQYPDIPLTLHTSGPLMEWLVENRPDYVSRLRRLVQRDQVEILGGGFYEPILPMIPPRDRVGQVAAYKTYLETLFDTRVRGAWVPERVWEQCLVGDLADAGVGYTLLDDFHFKQAGLDDDRLTGCYLSEYDGRLVRIFPISERTRYLIPFRNPEETIAFFGELAGRHPDAVVVFGDDGEKFGSWPETHKHCYTDAWLRRFFDALRGARSWVRYCTLGQALDETQPVGRIFLPDCSYREMTEWALPPGRLNEYRALRRDLEHDPRRHQIERFLRGGVWRNFQARYPELQEMYARMLQVSRRLRKTEEDDPNAVSAARQELYRAQCNCPWWHGTFGGLYLPHLRQAVYHHLLNADNALLAAEDRPDGWIEADTGDFNLDGTPEVCLANARLSAYFHPARGGALYELDLRPIAHNLLATLSRRYEAYHDDVRRAAGQGHHGGDLRVKQQGLEQLLQYDAYLRKSLVDHFFEPGTTLEQLAQGREVEQGDFVSAPYEDRVRHEGGAVVLTLRRSGFAAGRPLRLTKEVRLAGDAESLQVQYVLDGCPREPLHFAVEWNFAGLAPGADDRYFVRTDGSRAGQLQTWLHVGPTDRFGLRDDWLGLSAMLASSRPCGFHAFPVGTVSRSEGGFELVQQSVVLMPYWIVEPDAHGRWETTLSLRLDMARSEAAVR
jgi:4-alpha-glucanotransferase